MRTRKFVFKIKWPLADKTRSTLKYLPHDIPLFEKFSDVLICWPVKCKFDSWSLKFQNQPIIINGHGLASIFTIEKMVLSYFLSEISKYAMQKYFLKF